MRRTVHVIGLGFPEGPVIVPGGGVAFAGLTHAKIRLYRDGLSREICALPGAPDRVDREAAIFFI